MVGAARRAAHESVRRTPELLDVLREAGVVDAGGLGVAVVLDGVYACVSGQEIEVPEAGDDDAPDLEAIHAQEEAWGYCTEFLVAASTATWKSSRSASTPRAGVFLWSTKTMWSRSTYTQDRRGPLHARSFGRLAGVKIDDMEAQVRSREPEAGRRPDWVSLLRAAGMATAHSSSRWGLS